MARVLIAGAAGFLGSHLCKRLIREGHIVHAVDNILSGNKTNLIELMDNPGFSFVNYDISQPVTVLSSRVGEINYIFHLASPASPNKDSEISYMRHPIATLLANSVGTYNLLMLAKDRSAKFLFTSSSEVYGDPAVSPQPETYWGNVNPNGPRSVYDEGKRFAEAMTFGFLRKYDLNVRLVRIFNTYGPFMHKDDGRVVSTFINQALENLPITVFGDGSQTRSFCYVDDMVEGVFQAMFHDMTKGEVINLGNPDERTVKEAALLIKSLVGSKSEIIYKPLPIDDPTRRKPDITKAKRLLGWEPKVSLENGLKKTISYFRNL